MSIRSALLVLCAVLSGATLGDQVSGQEHKHEAANAQKEASDAKSKAKSQAQDMKCCEGMEKMGGMPMKGEMSGDMKAKMEMMKEMKAKMAEKMKAKGADQANPKAAEPPTEKNQATKDAHGH
jgi:hypothetical protein